MDGEDRLGALEATIQRLMQRLDNVAINPNQQEERPLQHQFMRNQEDRTIKIDIPEFDGNTHDPET